VSPAVTLKGIDQAISNLNYSSQRSLKYRLVAAIRDFCEDEDALERLGEIDSDVLIRMLWMTGDDPVTIRHRRKNLSSIRSSVNADLKRLYDAEKNPEGVTIGPKNTFVLSDEAKDNALDVFKNSVDVEGSASLEKITDVLRLINRELSEPRAIKEGYGGGGDEKFDRIKDLIRELSKRVGAESGGFTGLGPEGSQGAGAEEIGPEEVEEDDLEEVDLVEETEEVEADDDLEGIDGDEELASEEVEEDALEEIDLTEETEEVEVDEVLEEIDGAEETEGEEVEEEGFEEVEGSLDGHSFEGLAEGKEKVEKAKVLAEAFNQSLAAMDRYYNQYILIPKGEYVVGGSRDRRDERTKELVSLSRFYIGKFPITNILFEIFVEKTGYRTTAERVDYGIVYHGRSQRKIDERTGRETFRWNSALVSERVEGACWYQPTGPGSTLHMKRNHPVVQVSFEDAVAFASWTGKRLPTENEWEAASRTIRGYPYPWGETWREDACNLEEASIGATTPVDRYVEAGNDLGIVDTLGNVLEWTMTFPGGNTSGSNGPGHYVAKGGSWITCGRPTLCTRTKLERESHSNILGFRCVAY
jgi:formylglycine-generating enzyme required for sulfatase activity